MRKNNKSGYSIIIAIFLTGFLLILTVGVFNLVLRELNDNKGMGDYLKSFAGAEGAQELALLEIKDKGYGYYKKVEDIDNDSKILAESITGFNKMKDVAINYDLATKVKDYNGTLKPESYDIIPLFYIDDSGDIKKISSMTLDVISSNKSKLAWNLTSTGGGMSGIGKIGPSTKGTQKIFQGNKLKFIDNISVNNFLSDPNNKLNYLILFNSDPSSDIDYTLNSNNSGEFFTKPKTSIISKGQVGKFRQNLITDLDNTEFLNMLKYSIYSN